MIYIKNKKDKLWELFHTNTKNYNIKNDLSYDFNNNNVYSKSQKIILHDYLLEKDWSLKNALLKKNHNINVDKPSATLLQKIATMLLLGYNKNSSPSAGGIYPIKIFFHCSVSTPSLPAGIYTYNANKGLLYTLNDSNQINILKKMFIQKDIIEKSIIQLFFTAETSKMTARYGDRGYRYLLVETGHIAQNFNLLLHELELKSTNIGGYFDNQIDHFLNLNGIDHSTIYSLLINIK